MPSKKLRAKSRSRPNAPIPCSRCNTEVKFASLLEKTRGLGIGTVAGLLTDASPGDPDLVLALGVAIGQLFTTPFSVLVITALLFACLADERPFDAAKQLRYVHALDR